MAGLCNKERLGGLGARAIDVDERYLLPDAFIRIRRLLTLMLVLLLLHIYALRRRGQSRDRASEPESKPRRGFFHGAQSALRVLAAAFLWRTVRGRLRPGPVPWFPVSDPRTVCHPMPSQNGGWHSLIKPRR